MADRSYLANVVGIQPTVTGGRYPIAGVAGPSPGVRIVQGFDPDPFNQDLTAVGAIASAEAMGVPSFSALAYLSLLAIPSVASYRDLVIADGPVMYLRLGESSGNPQDSVGTNHVTSITGAPTYSIPGELSGDSNTAMSFVDDATDLLTVPDAAPLDVGDVFSIEFRLKLSAAGTNQYYTQKGATGGDSFAVYKNSSGLIILAPFSTGIAVAHSTTAITDTAAWHHVVATKNGSTRGIYIDGVDVTGLDTNVTLTNTTDPLKMSAKGGLDEFALYNYALTPVQVAAHYAASNGAVGRPSIGLGPAGLIALGAIASGEALGNPTIGVGGVGVTSVGAIASAEAMGVPVLGFSSGLIALGGIASGESLGSPTVQAGPAGLASLGGIASGEAAGTPTIGAGAVGLTALGGVASGEALGIPVIGAGAVALTSLGAIASSQAFGVPTLGAGSVGLTLLGGIASAEALGVPSISVGVAALTSVGGIASGELVGVLVVGGSALQLTNLGAISSGEVVPSLLQVSPGSAPLQVGAIPSAESAGILSLAALLALPVLGGIASGQAMGQVTIGPLSFQALTGLGAIASSETMGGLLLDMVFFGIPTATITRVAPPVASIEWNDDSASSTAVGVPTAQVTAAMPVGSIKRE